MKATWLTLFICTAAWGQDGGALVEPADPTVESLAAELDALWTTRDTSASLKRTDEVLGAGLKRFGEPYALLWRAARIRWWVADGTKDEKLKRQLGKEGVAFGERALKTNPSGAEAKYYLACSIGAYSQAAGIFVAIGEGLEGKFNENLDFALKHNESFDRFGAHTAKGRYWWELPWPKRNLPKSKAELEIVNAKHPEHLRTWLFLAQTLLADGKPKEAKAAIERVTQGTVDYDPPEGRRIKEWAKPIAAEIDKALR